MKMKTGMVLRFVLMYHWIRLSVFKYFHAIYTHLCGINGVTCSCTKFYTLICGTLNVFQGILRLTLSYTVLLLGTVLSYIIQSNS